MDMDHDEMPEVVWVRGRIHHEDDDARDILERARHHFAELAEEHGLCDEDPEPWPGPRVGLGDTSLARWIPEKLNGVRRVVFQAGCIGGPGAFLVTEVVDLDARDRLRAQRAAVDAHAEQIRAYVLAWLPEATSIQTHGDPVGEGWARFSLPHLHETVRFEWPDRAYCSMRDVDAWYEHYADRPRPEVTP